MQCISWKSRWRLAQGRASLLSLGIRALTALAIMTKKQQESDTWLCFRLKESVWQEHKDLLETWDLFVSC